MKFRPDDKSKAPQDIELSALALRQDDGSPIGVEVVNRSTLKHNQNSPGGKMAKSQGCICPPIHDSRGLTVVLVDGHEMMLYRKGCPVHKPRVAPKLDKAQLRNRKAGIYTFDPVTGEPVLIAEAPAGKPKQEGSGGPDGGRAEEP